MMILVVFFSIYKNREVARCFHGYRKYAPHSDIIRYQNLCPILSSLRICIQIPLAYPALPNWHFQILPLYYDTDNCFKVEYVSKADYKAEKHVHLSRNCLNLFWNMYADVILPKQFLLLLYITMVMGKESFISTKPRLVRWEIMYRP